MAGPVPAMTVATETPWTADDRHFHGRARLHSRKLRSFDEPPFR